MALLIRTLLVWLLVLALPAQGVAAATMAFCGPHHPGGGAASHAEQRAAAEHVHPQARPQAHPQAHPEADAQGSHGDHGDHHQATAARADSADAGSSAAPAKGGHADQQKCSACASCCSIGAILNSVLAVPAPELSPTVFAVVVPTVDAFAVDGPDRPPRIVLA